MKKKIKNRCVKVFFLFMLGIFTLSSSMYAQSGPTITVKGNVKDNNNETIIGSSVVVKGTTIGTVTDIDGNYEIKAPSDGTLVFSYVGFIPQEVPISGKTSISVTLVEDTKLLSEIVVIGYGSVKKEDLTGSVTTISANSLAKGMATSASDLLVGKAAGVSVITDGGAPGASTTIRIRGGSSLSASNDPLIVIDGVPVDNSTGIQGMANPLSTINPNDIENFTVLKDASATAIYGSRASNGVIIITTKKGVAGKGGKASTVSYNGTFGISEKTGTVDVMSADRFRQFVDSKYGTTSDQYAALGDTKTNWQKQIFQTGFSTDHNVGVSGIAGKVPYRVSVGYTNESGILKTSSLERWTGAINVNPKFFSDMLSVQLSVKGVYNLNRFANTGAIGAATEFDPTQPVYMPNYQEGDPGNGYYLSLKPDGTPIDVGLMNPLDALESQEDNARVRRSIGNIQFDYKMHFLPELRANLNLGYDYSTSIEWKEIEDNSVLTWVTGQNKAGFGENENYEQVKKNYLMDFYLNYVKEFNKNRIDVMGGYSWQRFYRYNSTVYPYSDAMQEEKGTEYYKDGKSYASENYLISFFGRLNYSFDSRYLFTFTLRNDGSSRFAEGNRWSLFPSVALAWRISEEGFMKNQNVMSDLKLRAGYGVTGQQNLPDVNGNPNNYPSMAKYVYSKAGANYYFGDKKIQLLRPSAYDRNLKWEETTTYNMGLDFGFLGNRIAGNVDVYYRRTENLLNNVFIPAGTNFSNQLMTNQGELTNKGIEFNVTGHVIEKKDLAWTLNYNISYNENKITKMLDIEDPNYVGIIHGGISGGTGINVMIHALNDTYNSFYVYEQIYNEDGKPVEGAYIDQNNDGVVDNKDLITYKKAAPDVYMGLSSQLTYKNWDFNFALRASLGNYAYNNVQSNREAYGGSSMLDPTGFLKNRMVSAEYTNFINPQYLSTYYVQDASFVRMDNISLGYTFRNISKSLSDIRVYGTVQNPFVITKYTGLDPEFNNDGIDNNIYPRPRIFMLGLNVNF